VKEKLLAALKAAIPVGLGFAASQLGLSKLPQDIKAALAFVPAKIDAAIRAAVGRIALKATTVTNAAGNGGLPEGGMTKSEPFQIGDRWFVLMVVQDKAGARVDLFEKTGAATYTRVGSDGLKDTAFLATKATPTAKTAKENITALLAAAKELDAVARARPQAGTNAAAKLKELQVKVVDARAALVLDITSGACVALQLGCFAAGTKMLTRAGWRAIESIAVGDEVASRAEGDLFGDVDWKAVEATFQRTACVAHLHAGGQVIRTTLEHPFWADGKGWTPAGSLKQGDRIATLSGEWVTVEELYDTGEWEPVYNLRVADWHTYFVGDEAWGWSAWAHNSYELIQRVRFSEAVTKLINSLPASANKPANITKWVTNWWNTYGRMQADQVKEVKFAFGVANSLQRAGATEAQIRGVLEGICKFPVDTITLAIRNAFQPLAARESCVGSTPRRESTVGLTVRARMATEANPDDATKKMAYQDNQGQWWIYSIRPAGAGPTIPPTGYYEWERCDMGHHPQDAVAWWNRTGKWLSRLPNGNPGQAIREWMTDPNHYQLQLDSHNSSAAGITRTQGYFWVPPGTPD